MKAPLGLTLWVKTSTFMQLLYGAPVLPMSQLMAGYPFSLDKKHFSHTLVCNIERELCPTSYVALTNNALKYKCRDHIMIISFSTMLLKYV